MSLETWKQQFYPESAAHPKTDLGRTVHSLRKWIGLRTEHLDYHGLEVTPWGTLREGSEGPDGFRVDTSTCALCVRYVDEDPTPDVDDMDELGSGCVTCPLAETLGRACDARGAPYRAWPNHRDPEPMIAALRETAKRLEEEMSE